MYEGVAGVGLGSESSESEFSGGARGEGKYVNKKKRVRKMAAAEGATGDRCEEVNPAPSSRRRGGGYEGVDVFLDEAERRSEMNAGVFRVSRRLALSLPNLR